MPAEVRQYKDQLEGRTMLVRKAKVVPLEAIVRGYITGEYILASCYCYFGSLMIRMSRFWVGRVQEKRNSTRHSLTPRAHRVAETP